MEIQLKRGAYQNELTRFRYDVVLHIGTQIDHPNEQQFDWLTRRSVCGIAATPA